MTNAVKVLLGLIIVVYFLIVALKTAFFTLALSVVRGKILATETTTEYNDASRYQ